MNGGCGATAASRPDAAIRPSRLCLVGRPACSLAAESPTALATHVQGLLPAEEAPPAGTGRPPPRRRSQLSVHRAGHCKGGGRSGGMWHSRRVGAISQSSRSKDVPPPIIPVCSLQSTGARASQCYMRCCTARDCDSRGWLRVCTEQRRAWASGRRSPRGSARSRCARRPARHRRRNGTAGRQQTRRPQSTAGAAEHGEACSSTGVHNNRHILLAATARPMVVTEGRAPCQGEPPACVLGTSVRAYRDTDVASPGRPVPPAPPCCQRAALPAPRGPPL